MCTCYFGDLHELYNFGKKPKDVDWSMFIYGSIMGLIPWIIMGVELQLVAGEYISKFVWVLVTEYWLLFFSFPINMLYQYNQWGKFNNDLYPLLDNGGYLRGEKVYQILSLFTKSLILWHVSAQVVWPNSDNWLFE